MPSSSLVEVEVGVEVFNLQMKSYHPFRGKSYFSGRVGWVGWMGGWRFGD